MLKKYNSVATAGSITAVTAFFGFPMLIILPVALYTGYLFGKEA